MPGDVEFGLLGPLLVRRNGAPVPVPLGKQRAVLAALLLRAGRRVSVDELAGVLWDEDPPPSARATIQNYVMRLRKALGDADGQRITTVPGGYQIRADPGELDLTRFESLAGAARAAARGGRWDAAASQAAAALDLWRGTPLADVDGEWLAAREVPRLAELRLQALETRIDADRHLGRHAEVIAELGRLTGEHPLRERLHALLMLALYRDGRQAEALAAYQRARQVLADELGIEPGAELRDLHQQILTADPALDPPAPRRAVAADPAGAPPRELPAAVPQFTGREAELDALTRLLVSPGPAAGPTAVITAIGGTAGVGKTALAISWAHRHADQFPDGQLYVNLRGYDPGQPVPAADALARFLRALGVPGPSIPADPDERAARYRSLVAGRRMLIVADNAGSAEQVRPLLPGSPGCTVIVTSRDSLAGLIARDGAVRLDLDLLPQPEAVRLLERLIGDRATADRPATRVLADRCGRLPLALRVGAELAVARPGTPLAGLVDELADGQRRLGLLDAAGDPRTAVRAVFSWSYRHLDPDVARAFRLAALHPGPDFDAHAVAALAGLHLEAARRAVDALDRAHLIQPAGHGRHMLHDLLRAYGRELAAAEDGPAGQGAALTRLLDYCRHAAAAAMDVLYGYERHLRPAAPEATVPLPPLGTPGAARAWLDAERATLVAVTLHAAAHGWPGHSTALAAVLWRYLDTGSHCGENLAIQAAARDAARLAGDPSAEGVALNYLASVYRQLGRPDEAARHLQRAMTLFRRTGQRMRHARAMINLGLLYQDQGRYGHSARLLRQALRLYGDTGDGSLRRGALGALADVEERQGQYARAAERQAEKLGLARAAGDHISECHALVGLGAATLGQGRGQQAADWLDQGLARARASGFRQIEAEALTRLGEAARYLGSPPEAASRLSEALVIWREIGGLAGEASALNALGRVLLAAGQPREAALRHAEALARAGQAGEKLEQARARHGLGDAWHAAGEPETARLRWEEALAGYASLGVPAAAQVSARLEHLAATPAGYG